MLLNSLMFSVNMFILVTLFQLAENTNNDIVAGGWFLLCLNVLLVSVVGWVSR